MPYTIKQQQTGCAYLGQYPGISLRIRRREKGGQQNCPADPRRSSVWNQMKDQILLFHFKDEHRLNTVRKVLMTLKIKYKLIEDEECDQPIGSFVGLEAIDIPPAPSAPLTEEVMVMCGLNDGGIQLVLTALRKAGIYIP